MNFLELFNAVVVIANPNLEGRRLPSSMDDLLADTDVDSFDAVMCSIYLCDLYGIDEETGNKMPMVSARAIQAFIEEHKTKAPASVEAAVEAIK